MRDSNNSQKQRVLRGETGDAVSVYQAVYQNDAQTAELLSRWEKLDAAARADVLAVVRGLAMRSDVP
tara:strand:+ start:20671 stop:20871 length:201 start_codon:yes stop_codon:yes gene_type:complete